MGHTPLLVMIEKGPLRGTGSAPGVRGKGSEFLLLGLQERRKQKKTRVGQESSSDPTERR